ncbi:MAG: hypothetical protein J6D34_03770 [Atopobiaceae bacterium]|nr:hypothetical protein [Atopobiaceae bacterium]
MGYVETITAAVELAGAVGGGVKYLFEHADDIRKNLDNLVAMLRSAKTLLDTAGDVVSANALKQDPSTEALEVEVVNIAGDEDPGEPKKTKDPGFLRVAMDKAVAFRDDRISDVSRWRDEQALRKKVHDAKRTVLNGASIKMSLTKLVEQLNSDDDAVRLANMGVLDAPGCFAIATYGKFDLGGDPTDYHGIYVGKATCVGDGIAAVIVPSGNADVYADIKYKQNVWVYVFTCVPDMLDDKYDALVNLLEASKSYNARQGQAGE